MTKIISISLTDEEKQFLEDMELSPTALLKNKIQELQGGLMGARKRVAELEASIEKHSAYKQNLADFINKKGLMDEFLESQRD